MKIIKIAYVVLNVFVGLAMVTLGYMHLTQATPIMVTMNRLGYPRYFTYIVGTAEILGAIALLLPRFIVGLKEFAYAGLTLLLLGALASHLIMDRGPFTPSILLLASVIISNFLRKRLLAGEK